MIPALHNEVYLEYTFIILRQIFQHFWYNYGMKNLLSTIKTFYGQFSSKR